MGGRRGKECYCKTNRFLKNHIDDTFEKLLREFLMIFQGNATKTKKLFVRKNKHDT